MIKKIRALWHGEQNLRSAALILLVTMLLSNVLGFFRDLILANSLPLSVLDRYYAAFRIPDFLFNLFVLGAISSAFIPVYTDLKGKHGDQAAWRLTQNLINSSLLILLVFAVVLFSFMPQILPFFVPGFSPDKLAQTIPLVKTLLLSPFFFAVSYVVGGVLNANKRFFSYSLAPLFYNASIIVGALLSPRFGVMGVAWAVVIGAALHMSIQLPSILALGYRHALVLNPFDKQVKRVFRLMVPRALSLGMVQIVLIFFTRFASELPAGAVSIFALTNNIQTTPTAIFAASIATAVFPMLGIATSKGDDKDFRQLLTESLKGMFFYMIPSMILLWVFRAHIIRLYLALNHQTWADTIRAIQTFQWFIIALVSQGANLIIIRAFYARHDTRRPMYISLVAGALTVTLAWMMVQLTGDVPGLSLAFAIGNIAETLTLFAAFYVIHPTLIDYRALKNTIIFTTILAIVAGGLARLTLSVVSQGTLISSNGLGTTHVWTLFVALVAGSIVGIGSYLGLAHLFHRPEASWLRPKRAVSNVSPLVEDSEEIAAAEDLAE